MLPSSSTTRPRYPTPPGSELEAVLFHATDNPDLQPHRQAETSPPTKGDLARTALAYLAVTRPELVPVID